MAKLDRPKASSLHRYGIVYRPTNTFWTTEAFDSPEAARRHWDAFWRSPGFGKHSANWRNYRVVRVRQSVSYVSEIEKP